MNIESKIWNFSSTGTKVHAFVGGTAICRKSIKEPGARLMDFCEARQGFKFAICTSCEAGFNAAVERYEDSMRPATGEGDHLPPAEDCTCPALERRFYGGDKPHHPGCDLACGSEKKETTITDIDIDREAQAEVLPPAEDKSEITPEVIEALRFLRKDPSLGGAAARALDVLDNAGIFSAIDEVSGDDKDTCPADDLCTCVLPDRGAVETERESVKDDEMFDIRTGRIVKPGHGSHAVFTDGRGGPVRVKEINRG